MICYGVIGLISNVALYLAYIFITANGVEHKLAMSVVYVLGVMQTFYFNKKFTFANGGQVGKSFARYCAAYALGYLLNFGFLFVLVDKLKFPHQFVQGGAIFVVAALIFVLQKIWVFRARKPVDSRGCCD